MPADAGPRLRVVPVESLPACEGSSGDCWESSDARTAARLARNDAPRGEVDAVPVAS